MGSVSSGACTMSRTIRLPSRWNCLTFSNRPGTASPVKGTLQQHLTLLPEALLLAVPMLLGGACAAIQRFEVRDTERMLAAAGFHMRPADTPEAQEDHRSIPPHRIVGRTKDGNVVYVYADPDNCHCVYVGCNKEYSEYERLRVEREITQRAAGRAGGAP
jgi:hypothetical protein